MNHRLGIYPEDTEALINKVNAEGVTEPTLNAVRGRDKTDPKQHPHADMMMTVIIDGEPVTRPLWQWDSYEEGVDFELIWTRHYRGMSDQDAVTKPRGKYRRRKT